MRKNFFLLIILLLILSACNYKNEDQTINHEGNNYMRWENPYFMELCSRVFDKPGDQITDREVCTIEKIIYIDDDGVSKIRVYLLNTSKPTIIEEPELTMRSLKDLANFKSLSYFELYDDQFTGAQVFKDLPQLKTLVLRGDINNKLLVEISESSYIESITIPFLDLDYSALAQISNLKTIVITKSYKTPASFRPLLTLPSENCLIDLGFLYFQALTPELYEVLSTHPNISKIGQLTGWEKYDLSFLENMKHLTALSISTDNITSISKMTWLKELDVSGSFDPSQLADLSNLELLALSTRTEQSITLDIFSNMKNLQELRLGSYIIPNLNGIEACAKLKSLTIYSCLVEDITALRHLRQLEHLALDNNLITDINALQSLTKLKHISLYANEIYDITPLKNCVNMEFLCLDDNLISDIRPLSKLPKLEELQIQVDDSDTKKEIDLISWRKTLLSLPNLKFYAGGILDSEWIAQYLPNVKHGRREMLGGTLLQ